MRAMLAIAFVAGAGCIKQAAFHCETDRNCVRAGEQGTCEPLGLCSFRDPACASGRRYGELSGGRANDCVGEEPGGADASVLDGVPGVDAPILDAPPSCPPSYAALAGVTPVHFYRVVSPAATWTAQLTACSGDGQNVHLAIPDGASELAGLVTLAGANAWLGIFDGTDEGVFVTVQGTAAPYLPWGSGEPDNAGNQDCVLVNAGSGTIETDLCSSEAIAICECDP